MKNLHTIEINQTEAQTKQKELRTNKEKYNDTSKEKSYAKSTDQTPPQPKKKSPTK